MHGFGSSLPRLCTSQSFYYLAGMLLSPLLFLHYLLYRLLNRIIGIQWLTKAVNSLLLLSAVHFLLHHGIYCLLLDAITHHPVFFLLYTTCCFSFSFYFISCQLATLKKRDIQVLFIFIRILSGLVMVSATASVRVSLFLILIVFALGFVTQKVKFSHLLREWRIIQDFFSAKQDTLEIDLDMMQLARNELMTLKSYLRVVRAEKEDNA